LLIFQRNWSRPQTYAPLSPRKYLALISLYLGGLHVLLSTQRVALLKQAELGMLAAGLIRKIGISA